MLSLSNLSIAIVILVCLLPEVGLASYVSLGCCFFSASLRSPEDNE
jgi:hypothetical protein